MAINLQRLTELCEKYGSDKKDHSYLPHYAYHLPERVDRILEIGCEMGESLRMWREIYPGAEIHTIDLFENTKFAQEDDIKKEGFITVRGDQYYRSTYKKLIGKFDVIIEDGSHRADHQLFSFYMLFENFLKSEGLYVAEDLHCCTEPFFRGSISTFEDTLLGSIERSGSWFHAQYGQLIENISLYERKIAFIKKRIC